MFVEAGKESYRDIILSNSLFPCIITHELTEMSLIHPKSEQLVLGDMGWDFCILKGSIKHHTRWFRDGFSNYTALVAYRNIETKFSELAKDEQRIHVFTRPFSSLSKVGKRLFKWHQFNKDKEVGTYYNAASGLF